MALNGTQFLDGSADFLGIAARSEHVQSVFGSLALFFGMQAAGKQILPAVVPAERWSKLTDLEKTKVSGWCVSIFHALTAAFAAIYILGTGEGTVLTDRMNGVSPHACYLFCYTIAYFMWDLVMVFRAPSVDFGFLAHHLVGISTLVIMLHPFVQFYGLCCTLFELSTPFLSFRSIMLALGYKGTTAVKRAELLFGVFFLLSRIIFGVPMALTGIYEGTMAMQAGRIAHFSQFVFVFSTNIIMVLLNVYWFKKILSMRNPKPKEA
mmetsp:Transcript_9782/g.19215  ORF Transcript_9782/g.19215 Transcript_9782/m.19215 type:complete len:265 (-) Transcript_9782:193-987(-)|eukprot:CAMPEP_0171488306 /NCGR_PEP_ID=MMETSP0958-20121227/2133_1 /TAXON_ID=87120 /ORGANISM="Aurantiochytrium limacinum, Strain ATCCMYA-1381" /LENGTH=264 /DNA_ID=CAMNT_0012021403 /DNA_START=427 /DNA_END=1221 /DNA_ORIENTATION=+